MYAYSIQVALTILFGPAYGILYLVSSRKARKAGKESSFFSLIKELKTVQTVFFASNGFFIGASAVASFVYLSQNTSIFEIAEIQAMAFLQVNSIIVIFFCLIRPMSRWVARLMLHTVVFVLVIVVLGRSQLSSTKRRNWLLASHGCAHKSTDYGIITPALYPSWVVAIFAVAGMVGFWIQSQSLQARFKKNKAMRLFWAFMFFWVLLIGLMTVGMITGLLMMWRQRKHLRSVAAEQFEDDAWGFGQVAALFIWAPIPVELLYIFLDR